LLDEKERGWEYMVALLAYHFGWSLDSILNLSPGQIHILQSGLNTLLYDMNGGAERDKDKRLKDYMTTVTADMQKSSNLPKGKIKLDDMLKALDSGKIGGR